MPTESNERKGMTQGSETSTASFESSISRLTEIVEKLEQGELPLEDSLRLFEEGIKLSRISQERLDRAQKTVEELLRVDDAGRATTAPFATTDDDR
jgi:exodeoxyribonuclease VII small subunit